MNHTARAICVSLCLFYSLFFFFNLGGVFFLLLVGRGFGQKLCLESRLYSNLIPENLSVFSRYHRESIHWHDQNKSPSTKKQKLKNQKLEKIRCVSS